MLRHKMLCAALAAPFLITGGAHAAEITEYVLGAAAVAEVRDDGGLVTAEAMPARNTTLIPFTPTVLAAEAFGGMAAATAELDLGIADGENATTPYGTTVWVKFPGPIRYQFNLEITVEGAEFQGEIVAGRAFQAGEEIIQTTGDWAPPSDTEVCRNFPRANKVVLNSCGNPSTETDSLVLGVQLHNLKFAKPTGLSSEGGSVKLTATLIDAADDSIVHTSDAAPIFTSKSVAVVTIEAVPNLRVCAECNGAFTKLEGGLNGVTDAAVGEVNVKENPANYLDTMDDLVAFGLADAVMSATIIVRHDAFDDDAFHGVSLGAKGEIDLEERDVVLASSEDEDDPVIDEGSARFTVPVATLAGMHDIMLHFDGENTISSAGSGRAHLVFNAPFVSNYGKPKDGSGTLASIGSGGLEVQLNAVRSSSGNGSDLYRSVIRVNNSGPVSGPIDVTIWDSSDAGEVWTWTSPMVPAGQMVQWTAAQLEEVVGVDVSDDPVLYTVDLEGPVIGYAQHLNWNAVDNLFSDLSGFRNGPLNVNP